MSLHNDNLITIEVQALRNLVEEAYWAGQSVGRRCDDERNAPGGFLEDMLTGYRYSVKKGGDA
tara:strand:- start:3939 stop:4127 length:189 start_codon:yes stop_codon:yes gene_type:complete